MKIVFGVLFFALMQSCCAADPDKNQQLPEKTKVLSTPYTMDIAGIPVGSLFHITGKIQSGSKFIEINFQQGLNGTQKIPVHFSNRVKNVFYEKLIFNSKVNGTWQDEIKTASPFTSNSNFDFRVYFRNSTHVTVYGNRQELGVFKLRDGLNYVDTLLIDGNLEDVKVNTYLADIQATEDKSIARFISMTDGQMLRLSGKATTDEFKLRLFRSGQHREIAFEMKVNYKAGYVACNSFINEEWGAEEREGDFDISRNELIDIVVYKKAKKFYIYINEKEYATFDNRFDGDAKISKLEISGGFEWHTGGVFDAVKKPKDTNEFKYV